MKQLQEIEKEKELEKNVVENRQEEDINPALNSNDHSQSWSRCLDVSKFDIQEEFVVQKPKAIMDESDPEAIEKLFKRGATVNVSEKEIAYNSQEPLRYEHHIISPKVTF